MFRSTLTPVLVAGCCLVGFQSFTAMAQEEVEAGEEVMAIQKLTKKTETEENVNNECNEHENQQ